MNEAIRNRIVELARDKYAGFSDSHLIEKLVEVEKIGVSCETVRRLLRKFGLRSPQKRRTRKDRVRGEQKPRFGMMALADAGPRRLEIRVERQSCVMQEEPGRIRIT